MLFPRTTASASLELHRSHRPLSSRSHSKALRPLPRHLWRATAANSHSVFLEHSAGGSSRSTSDASFSISGASPCCVWRNRTLFHLMGVIRTPSKFVDSCHGHYSLKEQVFEMPTGGAAIMREGPNLLKLARKSSSWRSAPVINYRFYRVFPNGAVQYLHPKDGVYPKKLNPGR